MKVKDLQKILAQCDPEAEVVKSADDEGNAYQTVEAHSCDYKYDPDEYFTQIALKALSVDDIERGYTEEDLAPESFLDCVVLY